MNRELIFKGRFRISTTVAIVLTIFGAFVSAYVFQNYARQNAEAALRRTGTEVVELQTQTLTGMLEKYRILPAQMAHSDEIISLFDDPWNEHNRAKARLKAIEAVGRSSARDLALVDIQGKIFASAWRNLEGATIAQRDYFQTAMQGRLGRETLRFIGTERAYAFSTAVRKDGKIVGVIVIFVRLEQILTTWGLFSNIILLTDNAGTVILSNQNGWGDKKLKRADQSLLKRKYPGNEDLYTLPDGRSVLEVSRPLLLFGWTLHALMDYRPVEIAQRQLGVLGFLSFCIFGIFIVIFIIRRENSHRRTQRDKARAEHLEQLVQQRTHDLSLSNATLAREVEVRTQAEQQLRRAQNELIQSAKLAALGQMSATLSHEINQPLAAIRTYAENTRKLIIQGKYEPAKSAAAQVERMVERMSKLSRTLLGFARNPGRVDANVSLSAVINEAVILVNPRAKKHGISIRLNGLDKQLPVRADQVRLSQVIVNLLSNSIDALSGIGSAEETKNGKKKSAARVSEEPWICLEVQQEKDEVLLWLKDNGPGISEENREHIFEPFFTTKSFGEGIGIGLSIVYTSLKEMQASIELHQKQGQGACFLVRLKKAHGGDKCKN